MNTEINEEVFKIFPELESKRLCFRAFRFSDAAALFAIRSNDEVMKYMDTDHHKSEDEAAAMINNIHHSFENKEGINWVIEEKQSGHLIGYFGFWRLMKEHVRAEIGYALLPNFWGRGYMTEACEILLQFGFHNLNVHSIEANVNKGNKSSMKLLQKMGFQKEAHFRENYFFNGRFYDSIIYSLLEEDWIDRT